MKVIIKDNQTYSRFHVERWEKEKIFAKIGALLAGLGVILSILISNVLLIIICLSLLVVLLFIVLYIDVWNYENYGKDFSEDYRCCLCHGWYTRWYRKAYTIEKYEIDNNGKLHLYKDEICPNCYKEIKKARKKYDT